MRRAFIVALTVPFSSAWVAAWLGLAGLSLALIPAQAYAQSTPAGLWQSVDDATGKPRALVRIVESGGVFTGRIERSLQPITTLGIQVCTKCEDDRAGKPLIGLDIVRGAKVTLEGQAWEGGTILDPDTGKIYRLRLALLEDGAKLQVRGYIGPFFRNQMWVRQP